jgi:hypothetical protein
MVNFFWKPGPEEIFRIDETLRSALCFLSGISADNKKEINLVFTSLAFSLFLLLQSYHELCSPWFGIFGTGCWTF